MKRKKYDSILPPPLEPGAHIRIVSPAGPVNREMLERGIRSIEKLGYTVSCAPHVFDRLEYLAGTDRARASDLIGALTDPKVDGVICSRGGYGSGRLLGRIPWDILKDLQQKAFIGFSDIGALALNLWAKSGWVTYLGPQAAMGFGSGLPASTVEHLLGLIQGRERRLIWKKVEGIKLQPIRQDEIDGTLVPCCLSILASLVGTPWMPDLSGCVLCLEDLNEPPYRVDRMIWQLQQAGAFEDVAGVLLGHFLWSDSDISAQVGAMICEMTASTHFPVWNGVPFGHVDDRMTLPVGIPVRVSPSGELDWLI